MLRASVRTPASAGGLPISPLPPSPQADAARQRRREMAVVVAHLTLFSQLGVLTRVWLDKLFADGCTGGWGVCLTSTGSGRDPYGAYFPDLPANALGCFLMGLLAASSTLTLGDPKPLAALPASHPWQAAPELHIGLRTGFCGSLTTLSSWAMALTLQLIGGDGRAGRRPAQWAWGWVVGLHLALGSYTLGEHAARLADDRGRPASDRAAARAARAAAEEEDRAAAIGDSAAGGVVVPSVVGGSWGRAAAHRRGGGGGGGGGAVAWPPPARENWGDAAAAALGAALAAGADEVRLSLTDIARHHAARPPDAADPVARAAVAERVAALRRAAQGAARAAMEDSTAAARARRASARRREAPLPLPPPPPPTVEVSVHASELAAKVGAAAAGGGGRAAAVAGLDGSTASGHRHRRPLFNRVRSVARTVLGTRPDAAVRFVLRTHIAVALLAGGLWAGAALALALDSKTPGPAGEARRTRWAAVLLAPFGCILRWRLAPLNYRLRGRWRALPAGTLAANALGCLATALLSVVAVRALPPASPAVPAHSWGRVWTRAAQAGFCGALSTVSTFMAETGAQLRRVPADASGYAYVGLTWAVAVVVTVIAYGPAVWA